MTMLARKGAMKLYGSEALQSKAASVRLGGPPYRGVPAARKKPVTLPSTSKGRSIRDSTAGSSGR